MRKIQTILFLYPNRGDRSQTAEDYVQSACVRLAGRTGEKKITYNDFQHLTNLIVKTALLIIGDEDHQLRQKRSVVLSSEQKDLDRVDRSTLDADLDEAIIQSEFFSVLSEPKQALLMLFLEGFSLTEIADKLEVHRATVHRQYNQIIAQLREQVEADEKEDE